MVPDLDIALLVLQLGGSNERWANSVQEGQGVGIFVRVGVELVVGAVAV